MKGLWGALAKLWRNATAKAEDPLQEALAPLLKTAYKPITTAEKAPLAGSKFSGVAALAEGEGWPCCQHCQRPMQLFLQLNSHDLPDPAREAFGEGLLQVFYCTDWELECEVECEAFFPFANSTLVRVLAHDTELQQLQASPVWQAFPERAIKGWQRFNDYPDWQELDSLSVEIHEQQLEQLADSFAPASKDKLLGWPNWVQGIEYPDCPDCGSAMQLVFQIDSNDNLPFMFGDAGCAHITQCRQHPERLTIAWACS